MVSGIKTHFREGGAGEQTVVLIHGGGSDHALFSWKYTLPALAEHFRVIAPDLPGYGKSDLPPSWKITEEAARVTRQYLMPKNTSLKTTGSPESPFLYHIHFIREFLTSLAIERASLVGISMGGGIALGAALAYPGMVERLMLVDSYGLSGKSIAPRLTYFLSRVTPATNALRWMLQHSRSLVRLGLRWITYQPSEKILWELTEDGYRALRMVGKHPAWMEFQKTEITPHGFRSDFSPRLPDLKIPTMIVHGKNDRLISLSVARNAHRRIPDCQLAVFDKCGHLPPREKPGEFVQEVAEFLGVSAGVRFPG